MAAMAIRLKPELKTLKPYRSLRLFSTSSSSPPPPSNNGGDGGEGESDKATTESGAPPPRSSYFSDIKEKLRQSPPPRRTLSQPPPPSPFSPQNRPSKVASLAEIQKNLSEFRLRSSAPPPPTDGGGKPPSISFQDLYKGRSDGGGGAGRESSRLSFESIRESLRQLRPPPHGAGDRGLPERRSAVDLSLKSLKESLKAPRMPAGERGMEPSGLPRSIFGKESGTATEAESQVAKTEFVRSYTYGELGEKLRGLRPEAAAGEKKDWFSFTELNERLMKLREREVAESDSKLGGVSFKDLRESLLRLRNASDETAKRSSMQQLALLGQLGGPVTPSFMLQPPKEHLVEKYFHPDNMSSAEKMKLELQKVREEFKMSESDCGSSRVQIAQLTTKIKHLSSVLHKKDKHSRKGLIGMVEQRKKLLKYLRRTDWDSYCMVLSKLGLRDTLELKN
ncbi:hypothetical protein QJS10_CPB19g00642 [Acorus calamus]|uniref:Small ribosomal subunit protein uS15c n=1 Tax=Acorus calamus TaxID=4465 RepID=A0AAV9CI99_ACOCL|nr:hypothetical protein QJS10_CPB19g00642 [Acorus calamus]